jgi:hypothetical protein
MTSRDDSSSTALACDNALTRAGAVERVTGIEPA